MPCMTTLFVRRWPLRRLSTGVGVSWLGHKGAPLLLAPERAAALITRVTNFNASASVIFWRQTCHVSNLQTTSALLLGFLVPHCTKFYSVFGVSQCRRLVTSSYLPVGTQRRMSPNSCIMAADKPNVVFVLGAPGSGKGTQCAKIVERFGYVHLSAGDLLRAERNNPKSQYGELIEHHITNGTIVPVAITCSLLNRAMMESGKKDFLIDGFPRNQDNLEGWNSQMGEDKVNLKFVLFFDCAEDVCVERCLKRGASGSGRSDDNEESLKKRFVTYMNATMPIIEYFRERGLVRQLDANLSPNEVFAEVQRCF